MRIFAIAHILHFGELQVECLGIDGACCMLTVRTQRAEVIGNGTIVLRGMREYFFGEREAGFVTHIALPCLHFG